MKSCLIPTIHYLFGCRFDILVQLLWKNRKSISKRKIPQIIWMLMASLVLFPFALLEELFYYLFISWRKMERDPIFILGHWRSGTTYLHYLLACDKRFCCFLPASTYFHNNCLLLTPAVNLILKNIMQSVRHMDKVDSNVDSPSEEAFAFANTSAQAFMHLLAFPSKAEQYIDYGFLDQQPRKMREKTARRYRKLYKKVLFMGKGERLLLKSPDHTCHAGWLAKEFPGAEFVHIYRNPYDVIQSTIHMVVQAQEYLPLEKPASHERVEDAVINLYARAHQTLFKDLEEIGAQRLVEIRYEDFVKEPLLYLKRIYRHFGLGGFDKASIKMKEYADSKKDYQKNIFPRDERLIRKINKKAAFVFEHYGYPMETV